MFLYTTFLHCLNGGVTMEQQDPFENAQKQLAKVAKILK